MGWMYIGTGNPGPKNAEHSAEQHKHKNEDIAVCRFLTFYDQANPGKSTILEFRAPTS